MGEDVSATTFTLEDTMRYRHKLRRCLDVLRLMLDDLVFDADSLKTGLEVEVNIVDNDAQPAMRNAEILQAFANPTFQRELGRFNLEINVPPRLIAGEGLAAYEHFIRSSLTMADEYAHHVGTCLVLIGILPTLTEAHTVLANLTPVPRYLVLNREILGARGGNIDIDIAGQERLAVRTDSIGPEAACTSVQFHIQVPADRFANYWNASQAIAGPQLAAGANSPFVFGRRLWDETRIALFEQAADTRSEELRTQGVRPRVWFGERWITSTTELFEENLRYFPPLLPLLDDEDPVQVFRDGGVPRLPELRLHNGTVYRWNRPVYDIMDGRPHLRVENRVLPAGPTVVDMLANAAFYFGLTRALAEADDSVWNHMAFSIAAQNFRRGAEHGLRATMWWPGHGELPAGGLIRDQLLPLAADGLDRFGTDPAVRDRLLGIIEGRCATGRTGAVWQAETVAALERAGQSRREALAGMLHRYMTLMHTNTPVHTWPLD